MKTDIALIGPGKVGSAVAQRLQMAGYHITSVVARDLQGAIDGCHFIGCPEKIASTDIRAIATAKIILLAVPDDHIEQLAVSIQQQITLSPDQTLIHFSGLHAAAIMRSTATAAATLSIHPLLPFASRQLASDRLPGCPCALEGDASVIALGEELIHAFAGQAFSIASENKALYHASACIASNFLVSLLASAADLLAECGIKPELTTPLLIPLVQASVDNVAQLGCQQGLTGPIVRGDYGTVASHLAALQTAAPNLLPLYQLLGEKTVELAQTSSRLPPAEAEKLLRLINSPERRKS